MKRALLAFTFSLLFSAAGEAYPDLIRHHYVNCTACHVAPTGGGVLNMYGKSMSRELLSASGGEREAEFLHGVLPEGMLKDWLVVGGDVRLLQLHKESPDRKSGTFIPMQAGIELGIVTEKISAVAFIGHPERETRRILPYSPRFYAMWTPQEQLSIRAGRFYPAFGINVPYHTLPTRQGMGFGAGQERDTLEAVWSGEIWNAAASTSDSPEIVPAAARENLQTAQVHRTFSDSHRVGASLLRGTIRTETREAIAAHAVLGFNERWAYVTEFDFQTRTPSVGGSTNGLFHFSQLIWEARKGWHFYLMEEYSKHDISDSTSLMDSYGPGLRYFPRPHFELDFLWLKKRTAQVADRYDDYAWMLFHYYF
jgi:hypothetical protein